MSNTSPLSNEAPLMTIKEVIALYDNNRAKEVVWDRIKASLDELYELSIDEFWAFAYDAIEEANPNCLQEKVNSFAELQVALSINANPAVKSQLIKSKMALINSASMDDLVGLVKNNDTSLKALIEHLEPDRLKQFAVHYAAGKKDETLHFLRILAQAKMPLIYQESLASLWTKEFIKSISSLDELYTALMIKNLPDAQKKQLIKGQLNLINAASSSEIIHLIKSEPRILQALADNLNHEELIALGEKFTNGEEKKMIDFWGTVQNQFNDAELIKLGKLFVKDDKKRVTCFLRGLNTKKNAQITTALTESFSQEELNSLLRLAPYHLAKEAGLILGLTGDVYNGSSLVLANQMAKSRFARFNTHTSAPVPLELHLAHDYEEASDFYQPLQEHGDIRGIHAQWTEHAFSFHLIKDGEKNHLIYVNRGSRHKNAKEDEAAVSVFSFDKEEDLQRLMPTLVLLLKRESKERISEFINDSLMPFKNNELSIIKSDQKTGNCTVANANIAWHFALVAAEMKKSGCSFIEAYQQTKANYKEMRREDRAVAFCELLTNPELEFYKKDSLAQLINKMSTKKDYLPLARLYEKHPLAFVNLLRDIKQDRFTLSPEDKKQWISAGENQLKNALAELIKKGADSTHSDEKKKVSAYLLKQVNQLSEPLELDQLTTFLYQAERVFSHVRNPFISRHRGASETKSYQATKDDFAQLRAAIGSYKEELKLSASTEIILDKQKPHCKTYKAMLNEMRACKQTNSEPEAHVDYLIPFKP